FKNSAEIDLCGILTKPDKKTDTCVVMCHGIGSDKEEGGIFIELAKKLADDGIASFRFDFMGHGESQGDSVEMTVTGQKDDIVSAFKLLHKLGFKKFGLLGTSFGAASCALFAHEYQKELSLLAIWNPVIDFSCLLEPKLPWPSKYFGPDKLALLEKSEYMEIGSKKFKIGKKLVQEMKTLAPWICLVNLNIPILFVHGDKDSVIPYEHSQKYSQLIKTAKLTTLSGSEHGFHQEKHRQAATEITAMFFSEIT
ncbi:MAG: alpha/beta hydrolase, partial [Candidatus Altiarchaeota archaeon]|nr:alpha/beta hydrolase [Candidatus Altiarchaeota archaeon]